MQRVFLLIILAVFAVGVSAQGPTPGFDLANYGVRIEPDKRLIAVLAALEMATGRNARPALEKALQTTIASLMARQDFHQALLRAGGAASTGQ